MQGPAIHHVIVDVEKTEPDLLDDIQFLRNNCIVAAEQMGAMVVHTTAHRFEPQGVTVIVVLMESHLSLHTWPEYGKWYLDVFTCGDCDPEGAVDYLLSVLGGDAVKMECVRPARDT